MSGKGKILYIINHMDWFWSHRLPLAKGAQAAGWDVQVAGPLDDKHSDKLAKNGFVGFGLPARTGSMPVFALRSVMGICKALGTLRPDCVHAITLVYIFYTGLAVILSGRRDLKCVYTIAGLGYLFSGEGARPAILRFFICPILRLILKRKGVQVIVQNPDDLDILIKRNLVDPRRSHLIKGSGVDLDVFQPKHHHADDSDIPIVLMPTRLLHDKGVAIFARAADILKQRGMQARFQIAGGLSASNPMAMTQQDMDDLTRSGAVEWLGRVEDMPDLLSRALLVAYPSYYREGIPKVLLEACAMGKPIITTDHPGCREAVSNGDNGLLIPIKDADALADAIESLLNQPDVIQNMEQKSLDRARSLFDVRMIVDQTLAVY